MIRFLQKEGPFKKFVLGGLLLIICAAMVIAFVPGGLGSELTGTPGKGVIAKVDGTDVTAEEVRLAARNMAQQQAQRYGEMAAKIMPFIIQQSIKPAADQLITREALLSQANRMGLRVTPEEVKDELAARPLCRDILPWRQLHRADRIREHAAAVQPHAAEV